MGFVAFLLIRSAAVIFIALCPNDSDARPHSPRSTPLADRVHYSSFFPHLYAEGHFPAENRSISTDTQVLPGETAVFSEISGRFPSLFSCNDCA
ncbi:MAG: hypothetical protein ACLTQI_05275 [Slackia sp.]